MKVILSDMCVSLVGTLERGLGYHIERRKNGFFSKKNQRGSAPRDGHWRFIVLCAELAQNHLYISDIEVSPSELLEALSEAGLQGSALAATPASPIGSALAATPASPIGSALAATPASTFSAEDILSIKSNVIRQNPSAYEKE